MKEKELLQLENLSGFTPKEIKEKYPKLFDQLNDRASHKLKTGIESKLKEAPKEIKDSLSRMKITGDKKEKENVKAILAKDLKKKNVSEKKRKELEESIKQLPDLGKLDDLLQPDVPIEQNPSFQKELTQAKTYRLTDLAGLTKTKADKIFTENISLHSISQDALKTWVEEKKLSKTEAENLGFTSNLYTFLDADFALTKYAKKNLKQVDSLKDMIKLDKGDWEKCIVDSKMDMSPNMSQRHYAEVLYT